MTLPPVLRSLSGGAGFALLFAMLCLTLHAPRAWAQAAAASAPLPGTSAAVVSPPATSKPAAAPASKAASATKRNASAALPKAVKPAWNELTPEQQVALAPLAGSWAALGEPQRRKWLAFSKNYHKLTPPEQDKLHSRMKDWAALSPGQRDQARMNFAEVKQLSPEQKAATWQAYQALSPEEKQKLAAKAPAKLPGAAIPVKPIPPQKLAAVPVTRQTSGPAAHASRPTPPAAPVVAAPAPVVAASGAPAVAAKP